MTSEREPVARAVDGVRRAARNVDTRQLARYIYRQASAFHGADHEGFTVDLIVAALDARHPPLDREALRERIEAEVARMDGTEYLDLDEATAAANDGYVLGLRFVLDLIDGGEHGAE